jgi:cytochrome c peroxidase
MISIPQHLRRAARFAPIFSLVALSAFCIATVNFSDAAQGKGKRQGAGNAAMEKLKAKYRRPRSIPFPEENPYTEAKARLGKALFFDPRMSAGNVQSCGSCHSPSFSWGDGLPKGVGDKMKPLGRRSPSILNAAWGEIFMWDGRFDTLEEQALGPIQADVEMNMSLEKLLPRLQKIREYREMFADAFGSEEITGERIGQAIATFERTIVSGEAPFDAWIGGDENAISESAKRGFAVFNGRGRCAACHSSWRFTDDSFHDIGLADDDIGRGKQLPNIVKMQHAFKTPGLRNIDRRGPYMHDGSLPTLEAVIDHYVQGGKKRPSLSDDMKPLQLSRRDKADLVAFLRTLTGNDQAMTFANLPR